MTPIETYRDGRLVIDILPWTTDPNDLNAFIGEGLWRMEIDEYVLTLVIPMNLDYNHSEERVKEGQWIGRVRINTPRFPARRSYSRMPKPTWCMS